MRMEIPFSKVDCSGNELAYIEKVLKSGWLTTASRVCALETEFQQRLGVKHALAVNSCTSALHLALDAVGVSPGDKVIVPSLTFTATAEVVRYMGADPVFVDIDYDTLLVSPAIIQDAIDREPDIKACIIVHFGGQGAEILNETDNGILQICRRHGVRLIQDAAHAFPARDHYGSIGSEGDVTCFSFYANKTLTTGEGGLFVTNTDAYAERAKRMRLHGIDHDIWSRFKTVGASWEYDVVAPGFKYNMPDVLAAIGLAQLERTDGFQSERQRCAAYYFDTLAEVEEIDLVSPRIPLDWHAWHLFPIVLNENSRTDRNELICSLNADGIGTSVHYKPLHRMTYYRTKYDLREEVFPQTEKYWNGCLSLPIYPNLSHPQLEYIVDRLKHYL